MTDLIRSDNPNLRVSFEHCRNASAVAVSLDDPIAEASWRLNIFVERPTGGWALLGAVITTPPGKSAFGTWNNRVVAMASCPGAKNWQVYPQLVAGRPPPGKSAVTANISMSARELLGNTRRPVAAIPGNSTLLPLTELDAVQLLLDPNGQPVRAVASVQGVTITQTAAGDGGSSLGPEQLRVLASRQVFPARLRFTNLTEGLLFGQAFNSNAPPAPGAVPTSIVPVPPGEPAEERYATPTILFELGCVVAFSASLPFYTPSRPSSGMFEWEFFPEYY